MGPGYLPIVFSGTCCGLLRRQLWAAPAPASVPALAAGYQPFGGDDDHASLKRKVPLLLGLADLRVVRMSLMLRRTEPTSRIDIAKANHSYM